MGNSISNKTFGIENCCILHPEVKVLFGGYLGCGITRMSCYLCDIEENDARSKKVAPIEPFAYTQEEQQIVASLQPMLDDEPLFSPVEEKQLAIEKKLKTIEICVEGNHIGMYTGIIVNGMREGRGVMSFVCEEFEGQRYEGLWKADTICGPGKLTFPNGDTYIGTFEDGSPGGVGMYHRANGEVFHGIYRYGGYLRGEVKWTNGERYSGDFFKSMMQGRGIYYHSNGNIYEGQFYAGKRHGYGKLIRNDGAVFRGHFLRGDKHGFGVIKYNDGSIVEGRWKNGKRHDIGQQNTNRGQELVTTGDDFI